MSEPWFKKINELEAELDEVKAHANETQTELEHMRTERDDYKARWEAMCKTAIPADDIIKERDDLKWLLQRINSQVMPGETDSVESMMKIVKDHDDLRARCERYELALQDIAADDSEGFSVEQQRAQDQHIAKAALAPSGGGGES